MPDLCRPMDTSSVTAPDAGKGEYKVFISTSDVFQLRTCELRYVILANKVAYSVCSLFCYSDEVCDDGIFLAFSFLGASDLATVLVVSRTWRHLAQNDVLWQRMLLRAGIPGSQLVSPYRQFARTQHVLYIYSRFKTQLVPNWEVYMKMVPAELPDYRDINNYTYGIEDDYRDWFFYDDISDVDLSD